MTNFEFYKDEILEIVNNSFSSFAVKDGKPRPCRGLVCAACDFDTCMHCEIERFQWLYAEHIEKQPKLTEKERAKNNAAEKNKN